MLSFLFNIVLEFLTIQVGLEKEIDGVQIGREEVKLPLFAYNMILHTEKLKVTITTPPKLLELINEFSTVAGHKIDTQISVAFLYTHNELSEMVRKHSI